MKSFALKCLLTAASLMFYGCGESSDIYASPSSVNSAQDSTQNVVERESYSQDVLGGVDLSRKENGDIDPSEPEGITIDVLAVFDASSSQKNIEDIMAEARHSLEVANVIFRNSGINAKLELVGKFGFEFDANDSARNLLEIANNEEVQSIRDLVNADIVVSFRPYLDDGRCGVAFVNKSLDDNLAFAHVSLGCPSTTLLHEVGHVLGLTHSVYDATQGHDHYGRGYGIEGEFATIMAYGENYATLKKAPRFSSPEYDCYGYECGVVYELENGADAVRSLKNTIPVVAKFR